MAKNGERRNLKFSVIFVAFVVSVVDCEDSGKEVIVLAPTKLEYCTFFNNRAPTYQPDLKNCTWFSERSCCRQAEIAATFGRVKPLQGATPDCIRMINYLMCYMCAPQQNSFYRKERLTVCEEFCDLIHMACGEAILKGSKIGELYNNGTEFCNSRRFDVKPSGECFSYDLEWDKYTESNGNSRSMFTKHEHWILILVSTVCLISRSIEMH